jgi:hypothetical protein
MGGRPAAWWAIAATGVMTMIIFMATPPYWDDEFFRWLMSLLGMNGYGQIAERYGLYVERMVAYDSPRMLNLLFPLFILAIPRWLMSIATALLWTWSLALTCRVAGIGLRSPLRVAAVIAVMELLMPWDNGMTCLIFAINYVWPLPLALLAMRWFTGRAPSTTVAAVTALAVGWTQEGLGLPLIAGMAMWFAVNRRWPSRGQLAIMGAMALGTGGVIAVSAFGRYKSVTDMLDIQPFKQYVYLLVARLPLVTASLVAVAATSLSRAGRARLKALSGGVLPLTLTAMSVSAAVGLSLWIMGDRLLWFPEFFAAVSLAVIVNSLVPGGIIGPTRAGRLLTASLLSIVAIHLVAAAAFACDVSYRLRDTDNRYAAGCRTFAPAISSIPLPVWNKTGAAVVFNQQVPWAIHRAALTGAPERRPLPVPAELEGLDGHLAKVAGDNHLYLSDGHWVMPDDGTRANLSAVITYSHGPRMLAALPVAPFTDRHGRRWLYVVRPLDTPQRRWCRIISVDLVATEQPSAPEILSRLMALWRPDSI